MPLLFYYLYFFKLQPIIEIDEDDEITVVWEKVEK